MAQLGSTKVFGDLVVTGNINKIDGGRYTRKLYTEVNSETVTLSTTWSLAVAFSDVTGFKAGSLIKLTYHMPMRNDSTSWGGAYIEPQIRFNSGTWQSLGSSGYDGGIMHLTSADIGSYFQEIVIDPGQTSDFSFGVRFYARAYDSTAYINGSHDINNVSGTASIMSGNNGLQHYCHIIVEELALIK